MDKVKLEYVLEENSSESALGFNPLSYEIKENNKLISLKDFYSKKNIKNFGLFTVSPMNFHSLENFLLHNLEYLKLIKSFEHNFDNINPVLKGIVVQYEDKNSYSNFLSSIKKENYKIIGDYKLDNKLIGYHLIV